LAGFTTGSPWISINDNADTVNVDLQTKDPNSLLTHYRNLIHARNAHAALRIGKLVDVETNNESVYAAIRQSKSEMVLILVNLENAAIGDYRLDFDLAGMDGNYELIPLVGAGKFPPMVIKNGSVSGYVPLTEIPANTNLVLLLKKIP
jgi:glycosidase